MSHALGMFFKYLAALLMFVFSISLAYTFFSEIQPPSMPWFVWAAMGLTEFGLLCWLAVFNLTHHDDVKKMIALVMVFICLLTVLFTDAIELARLFHAQIIIAEIYYYVLIGVFCAHLLAFVGDFLVSYFRVHSFKSPTSGTPRPLPRPTVVESIPAARPTQPQLAAPQAASLAQNGYLSGPKKGVKNILLEFWHGTAETGVQPENASPLAETQMAMQANHEGTQSNE